MTITSTEPPRLLSVEQAAHLLGIGRSMTFELVRQGRLRSLKIGHRRLVPREAIEEVIATLASGGS